MMVSMKDIIYTFEFHKNYNIIVGSIFGCLIWILIIFLLSVFKKIKKILEKRFKTSSKRLKTIQEEDKQLSIDNIYIYGDLTAIINDIADSLLNTSIVVLVQLAIFEYILTTFGPIFKLVLARMELVIFYAVKNFVIIVRSRLLKTIITKLLLSVSLNISLPILTVIVLSILLSLLPVNCEKFIVTVPVYLVLNLPKISTSIGRDRISSTQCGTEIVNTPKR